MSASERAMVEVGVCLGGPATDGDLYKREAGG